MDSKFISGEWLVICTKCQKQLLSSEFRVRTDTGKLRRQCKTCYDLSIKQWCVRNKEKRLAISRKFRETHIEQTRKACEKWRCNNLAYDAFRQRTRRANLLKRTPKWTDLNKIQEIYQNCPQGFHVDHIVPLCGKNVSGLHVPENLQYLSAIDNIRKKNIWLI